MSSTNIKSLARSLQKLAGVIDTGPVGTLTSELAARLQYDFGRFWPTEYRKVKAVDSMFKGQVADNVMVTIGTEKKQLSDEELQRKALLLTVHRELDRVARKAAGSDTADKLRCAASLLAGKLPPALPAKTKNDAARVPPPDGEWSTPMSKTDMRVRLDNMTVRKFDAFTKTHPVKPVGGNRQLFQIRLDGMDSLTRSKLDSTQRRSAQVTH